jgi:predicted deacylase
MNQAPTDQAPLLNKVQFPVGIAAPDLSSWLAGNTGLPGFTRLQGSEPGPHVAILSLMHGNELAGAVVLDRLLRQGIRPLRGTLMLGFVNIAAFARFNPAEPTASRFVDEDLNRVWDEETLRGPRESVELTRARHIRPLLDDIDILVDLHSMLWPSDPLLLSGPTAKGVALARQIPAPSLIVADRGHAGGRRLIDHDHFTGPATTAVANLIEAGQHWQPETVALTESAVLGLLHRLGMIGQAPPPGENLAPRRLATVTHVVTATTSQFAFVEPYRGADIIARRNTLIALDGNAEIRTPYDDCLLVMPALLPSRGHTAVRLARLEAM